MDRSQHQPQQHTPGAHPAWLQSQTDYRARSASLGAAADQMNVCRTIADSLRAEGKDHTTDPTWQAAARESHRLTDVAAADGYDIHAIGDEAAHHRALPRLTQ